MKFTVLVVVLFCAISTQAILKFDKFPDQKSLSPLQKLGVFALSNLKSSSKALPWSDIFAQEEIITYLDIIYIDYRSLLVQVIALAAETKFTGQKRTTSINEMTPSSFKNTFHVPHIQWHSPKFLLNVTDHELNEQHLTEDVYGALNNVTIITSADYTVVPELGLQIDNLCIDFSIGYSRTNVERMSIIRSDGSVELEEPFKSDITEAIREIWDLYKKEYETSLQLRINCFLSNNRSDPLCYNEDSYDGPVNEYFGENFLHLFETIVLGSMDRK
ncbi:unnamed protein product [Orchesella dallaii]|uniref:Uncharacterized protein n=1 Tax=Orchesella dallaii TaxID=48710 RepID=A0ABP1QIN7_9HEXA